MNEKILQLGMLAVQFLNSGKLQEAEANILQILTMNPNEYNALKIYAYILSIQKKFHECISVLHHATSINPRDPELFFNLGKAYFDSKDFEKSIEFFVKNINLTEPTIEVFLDIGSAYHCLKNYQQALAYYQRALEIDPSYSPALNNSALSFLESQDYFKALEYIDRAIEISPRDIDALSNRGNILIKLQRFDEAILALEKAVLINPNFIEASVNLANALVHAGNLDAATTLYKRISLQEPNNPENWINLGNALTKQGQYHDALSAYNNASTINSGIKYLAGSRFQMHSFLCDWNPTYNQLKKLLSNSTLQFSSIPFHHLYCHDSLEIQQEIAEAYSRDVYAIKNDLGALPKPTKKDKLKIAYFSADFREHPVAFLSAELYELHDRNKFEIIAFSLAPSSSPITLRIRNAFNNFIDASGMSDRDLAALARSLEIDIAVDLGGYTENSRPGIFSYRAAPIQLSYLGYLGTMGTNYMDYLVADRHLIPSEEKKYYTEKIIYLPSYQINDSQRKPLPNQLTRFELGLTEDSFVFCCCNHNYKITPEVFDGWVRILKNTQNSTLFLYGDNPITISNLKNEAAKRGLDSNRLIFGARLAYDDYLSRYKNFNLFLDTSPYNAGTTASDALWSDLPVLTLVGRSFASRMGSSLLSSLDLPELITHSQKEYEDVAIELARNAAKYAALKSKLISNKSSAALFNPKLFTKHLESAYLQIYDRATQGFQPEDTVIV